jgi:hypothetical protein
MSLPGLCAKVSAALGNLQNRLPATADVFRSSAEAAAGIVTAGQNLSEKLDTDLATQ